MSNPDFRGYPEAPLSEEAWWATVRDDAGAPSNGMAASPAWLRIASDRELARAVARGRVADAPASGAPREAKSGARSS